MLISNDYDAQSVLHDTEALGQLNLYAGHQKSRDAFKVESLDDKIESPDYQDSYRLKESVQDSHRTPAPSISIIEQSILD